MPGVWSEGTHSEWGMRRSHNRQLIEGRMHQIQPFGVEVEDRVSHDRANVLRGAWLYRAYRLCRACRRGLPCRTVREQVDDDLVLDGLRGRLNILHVQGA